jgi:hypothetical protein
VDAAGVVADHAADGATVVAGGIGGEGEVILFGCVAEVVEHYSGLDSRNVAGGIDFKNLSHVFREIKNNRDIAALTG